MQAIATKGNKGGDLVHGHDYALPSAPELETKACLKARAALAELKQAGELIPNQATLINTLPLLEAVRSTACWTRNKIMAFRQLHEHTIDF